MKNLRSIVRAMVSEAVGASAEYMKKEAVRQQLQDLIASKVTSGEIQDQKQLEDWFQAASMALMALKMVPLEAYMLKNIPAKKRR